MVVVEKLSSAGRHTAKELRYAWQQTDDEARIRGKHQLRSGPRSSTTKNAATPQDSDVLESLQKPQTDPKLAETSDLPEGESLRVV